LKLQQDELARSDPKDHTLRTSTFRLQKPHSYWSATGPRNKHYQQTQHTRTHDQRKQLESQLSRGGRLDRVWGRLDCLHQATKNSSETPLPAPKRTTVSPIEISVQGHASYQKTVVKTKTSPRGLGTVRPATRGGLTFCTQQRTPSKRS
jgi:hypothetical protein